MNRMSRLPRFPPALAATARVLDSRGSALSGEQPPARATTSERRRAEGRVEESADDETENETEAKRAAKRVMNASTK
jgi:hypothetical protein